MRPAFTLRQTRKQLTTASRRFLATLPLAEVCEGRIALIHGSVEDVRAYMTTPALIAENAARLRAQRPGVRVCLFGHTHVPRLYEEVDGRVREHAAVGEVSLDGRGHLYLVNPGSVDAARRANKRAQYAVLDTARATVTFHQVSYDHGAVEESARRKGYRMNRAEEVFHGAAHWLARRQRGVTRRCRAALGLA
jgi:predicted phosphodiesterase